ncbi:MAG TPA: poly(R)-hydroxyalkanoic acid synthase subunit PhaE [Saprospiraceae bacterium]|nr:poly(R)-hydroxyalkanoic acid synthase subunit PhaE [Saprospiraceae bacterium]HMQ85346.1 poly(R)-hydroxyalkanoic acid synthase subunit PhaE [Saprospiraceae bacterium]
MANQFDTILEGQKKALEFWSDLSGKMTKAFNPAEQKPTDGQELMIDWYKKQQAFLEEIIQSGDIRQAIEKSPEKMQRWIALQTEFAGKWLDFYKENAEKMGMKWPDFPSKMDGSTYFAQGMGQWKKWMDEGSKFVSAQVFDKIPFNMQPHYSSFLETYNNLHQYWEPILGMIKNGLFEKELVERYFSTEVYEKVINQMMGFRPVGNPSEAMEQVNKWFEAYFSESKDRMGQWNSIAEGWQAKMKGYFSKGNVPVFEMAAELNKQAQEQLLPFYNVAAQGKENEIAKLMRDIQFAYVSFLLRSAEMQSKVYESGQFVLPDTIKSFYAKYKESSETPDFQAFFKAYVDDLEKAMTVVLQSDEYSKLQSEIAATGAQIKAMTGKIMELSFSDMPFLSKSEADDFAQETASLKRKVRTLEDRLAKLEALLGNTDSKPAAKTPARSSRKKEA